MPCLDLRRWCLSFSAQVHSAGTPSTDSDIRNQRGTGVLAHAGGHDLQRGVPGSSGGWPCGGILRVYVWSCGRVGSTSSGRLVLPSKFGMIYGQRPITVDDTLTLSIKDDRHHESCLDCRACRQQKMCLVSVRCPSVASGGCVDGKACYKLSRRSDIEVRRISSTGMFY